MIFELGEKLLANRDLNAAIVCYILSNSVSKVLDLWKKRSLHRMANLQPGQTRESVLIELFERLILFRNVLNGQQEILELENDKDFNIVLAEIARYLTTTEERVIIAMRFLCLSRQPTADVAIAKDRLYKSNSQVFQRH